MQYFKDGTSTDLDDNLVIAGTDSQATTTTLFSENIDLSCFVTDDYKRLKNFLIPWYSSLRTFSKVMSTCSDIRSIPEDDLNNLINSFGFVDGLQDLVYENKIGFFYDLVNLYKIKGTPECIERVLGYFGMASVEILEYYLKYNSDGELVFHPQVITNYSTGTPLLYNIPFDELVVLDPHWFLTKDQVNTLFLTNKIAFPSKTPYFSLRPIIQLSADIINSTMAILSRLVQDQYDEYIGGTTLTKDILISDISLNASLLDLYLGTIYSFNVLYPKYTDSSDTSYLIYDGDLSLSNTEIFDLYSEYSKRSNNLTREEIDSNRLLIKDTFTRLRTTSFITSLNTAGTILSSTNSDLKNFIDSYTSLEDSTYILRVLLKNLSGWVNSNISASAPNLTMIILGFSALDYIMDVVNFFKPYRARLILSESSFVLKDASSDVMIPTDSFSMIETDTFLDFDTGDSVPNPCPPEENPCLSTTLPGRYYSRNTFDCGSYFDIGASMDIDGFNTSFEDIIIEKYNYHTGDSTACVHLEYTGTESDSFWYASQDGGWTNFDEGGIYDAPQISDFCQIYIHNGVTQSTALDYWHIDEFISSPSES